MRVRIEKANATHAHPHNMGDMKKRDDGGGGGGCDGKRQNVKQFICFSY